MVIFGILIQDRHDIIRNTKLFWVLFWNFCGFPARGRHLILSDRCNRWWQTEVTWIASGMASYGEGVARKWDGMHESGCRQKMHVYFRVRHVYTARTNYSVNLRVYTRTRNNAGNLGRLHASRGSVRCAFTPAGIGARDFGELCGIPCGLCGRVYVCMPLCVWARAKNVGTSVVYTGGRWNERQGSETKFNRW